MAGVQAIEVPREPPISHRIQGLLVAQGHFHFTFATPPGYKKYRPGALILDRKIIIAANDKELYYFRVQGKGT